MTISSQYILLLVGFVLLAGVILLVKRSNHVKGWLGERTVNLLARFSLDKKTYHLIKNVTLPTEDSTTQIDHIIVSKYGLFAVETKNMKGWIFGSEEDEEWTQQLNKHKNTFQNPLSQNYRHTKALEEILGLMPDKIFSVVVFVGNSTFKTDMPENVTYAKGYIAPIKSKTEPLFGEFEVLEIIDKIYDREIAKRPRSSSPVYKLAVIAIVLLVFGGVVKKTIFDKQDESIQQATDGGVNGPLDQQIESPAQKELNKVYQYKDAQGKTRYTNLATAPNAKLVDENKKVAAKPLPIEISGNKVLIPAILKNKGTQMNTLLILDEDSPTSIIPKTTADLVEAENLGPAKVTTAKGKTVSGEKRKVRTFTVGNIVEPDFVFLAVDGQKYAGQATLGMDFIVKHPFQIDKENKLLIWQ